MKISRIMMILRGEGAAMPSAKHTISGQSQCDYTVYSLLAKDVIHAVFIEAKRNCVSSNAVAQV